VLNIAVWGIGNHALRNTIPALHRATGVNLAGFLSRDVEKSGMLATEYGCAYWPSSDGMLANSTVDCIYIASPTGAHYEQATAALNAGKHVFCEKSMTDKHEHTVKLFQLANDKNLALFECFMYLHHRQFKQLKELLCSGEIGDVVRIAAQFSYPHLESDNIRYRKNLGGGALLDAGVYPLSAILALAKMDPLSVAGSVDRTEGYEVDTRGSSKLDFSDGVVGHAVWGMGLDYRNEIEIQGSLGSIRVDRAFSKPEDLESELVVTKNGHEQVIRCGADNHFINMFESFSQSRGCDRAVLNRQRISLGVTDAVSQLSNPDD
jgi:NDP-hexose-3-ketoreductase